VATSAAATLTPDKLAEGAAGGDPARRWSGNWADELHAHLAALSPEDQALVDHYPHVKGDDRMGEGAWIVAAPLTVSEAKSACSVAARSPCPRQT
jgi:hypothetical protein